MPTAIITQDIQVDLSTFLNQEYWIYADIFTHKYAATKEPKPRLVVFICERDGRLAEKNSKTLSDYIGHYVDVSELMQIIQKHFSGRYLLMPPTQKESSGSGEENL